MKCFRTILLYVSGRVIDRDFGVVKLIIYRVLGVKSVLLQVHECMNPKAKNHPSKAVI